MRLLGSVGAVLPTARPVLLRMAQEEALLPRNGVGTLFGHPAFGSFFSLALGGGSPLLEFPSSTWKEKSVQTNPTWLLLIICLQRTGKIPCDAKVRGDYQTKQIHILKRYRV